ncbi:MAG: type VI secretion system tip protein VgrG [Phycisphaerales bacterium]
MAKTQQHRQVAVETPLGEDVLLLVNMWGSEQLGRPFEFQLELASENSQIKFSDIVGQNVTVRLERPDGSTRYFNGFVSRFTQVSSNRDGARYSATVVPWLWFLTRTADCRIFQAMTVPDIVKQVFRDAGFSDFEVVLTETYQTWEYCVQYRETAFNFVSRLMEQEGIYCFFRHENGRHILVLADSPSAHKPCEGYNKISCQFSGTPVSKQEYISEWVVETRIQPGSCSLNAFDFKNTKKDLHARAQIQREHDGADFDVYDYSTDYTEAQDGESYARRRIEELHSQYEVATATSDARGLCAGGTFTLADHPRKDQNREWLIVGANYTISQAEFSSGGSAESVYSCSLTAIGSTEPFRAARVTSKPTIPGPQTALVVGPSGEEIHTDEYGRVKVQFHWDRYGKADDNSSCWIRVAQVWAGRQWGAIYTPRVGQEVIVEFLDGDPDHPIITGRVYNGQAMPPYGLPANKTISTLKSNTTKGGGGFNEIRFEDKKGEEQLFIHAQKNEDIRVKSDCYEWIGNNRHLVVKKDQIEHVENNRHETVDMDHIEKIGKDRHLDVKGKECKQVKQALSLKVGQKGDEKFGTNYALEAGQSMHLKAGMTLVIEAGTGITLKCGGNSVVIDPSGVTLKGMSVVLDGTTTRINSGPGSPAGSGAGCSPMTPSAPSDAEEADNADPGEVAKVKAEQTQTKSGKYGSTPTKAHKPDSQKKSWIEIELVDEEGNPVPGERYEVQLPDGSVAQGCLDHEGKARVEGIDDGNAEVRFPDLDNRSVQ